MNSEFTIRIGTEKDAAVLAEFNKAIALETEELNLDPSAAEKGVLAVFEDETKGFYVVAENENGQVVGGLMISFEWSDWRNAWFWWITSVYVLPEVRQKRIYTRLYDFVKETVGERSDVCGVRLYVDKDNKRAQKVYERLGMDATNYLIYEEEI